MSPQGAAHECEDASGNKSRPLHTIEKVLRECRIPVGIEGGVVIGELNPVVGKEVDSTAHEYDAVIGATMSCILNELGARRILAFGACNKYRWQSIEDLQLPGVSNVNIVSEDEEMTLQFERTPEAALQHVPQPSPDVNAESAPLARDVSTRAGRHDEKEREEKVSACREAQLESTQIHGRCSRAFLSVFAVSEGSE